MYSVEMVMANSHALIFYSHPLDLRFNQPCHGIIVIDDPIDYVASQDDDNDDNYMMCNSLTVS